MNKSSAWFLGLFLVLITIGAMLTLVKLSDNDRVHAHDTPADSSTLAGHVVTIDARIVNVPEEPSQMIEAHPGCGWHWRWIWIYTGTGSERVKYIYFVCH